jgi:hypothetical protein
MTNINPTNKSFLIGEPTPSHQTSAGGLCLSEPTFKLLLRLQMNAV